MSILTAKPTHTPAVLHDIDWRTYSRLLRVFAERRGYRLTYDRGTLEIMSPLFLHESAAGILDWFVRALADEFNMPIRIGRSVTLRRRRVHRGLEPDNCYWLANASRLDGKKTLDLRIDPPPDLAIEVDITKSSVNRMSIYSALRVPEVWRVTQDDLSFHVLIKKHYESRTQSLAFPKLAAADLIPHFARQGQVNDGILDKEFRAWVRDVLLNRPDPS